MVLFASDHQSRLRVKEENMSYPAKKAYREESVADLYDKDRFTGCKGKLTHRREMAVMMKALGRAGISAPARILDIPCGTGRLSRYLALRGFRMLGLDISAQMISRGRIGAEQIDRQNIIEFIVGDGDALPFHDGEFDAVVSLRLFGHTPPATRKEILGELRRVVQKYLILAYYNKVSLQY